MGKGNRDKGIGSKGEGKRERYRERGERKGERELE